MKPFRKTCLFWFISLTLICCITAEGQIQLLKRTLEKRIEYFHGDVGLYFKNLETGETITINAQDTFPTASLIKIPIAIYTFDQIEKGKLGYYDKWVYRDSMAYGGSGYLQFFKDSTTITVKALVNLMLTVSDNVAAIWLTKNLGGGDAINTLMDSLGFITTRMNSYSTGRKSFWDKYGWGMTTPEEMGILMERLFFKEILTPEACDEIYRILTHPYWDEYAPSQVPMTLSVASKTGALNDFRAEVACVNTPNLAYVICVITNNNVDQQWIKTNEADQLIINLNREVFGFYNPNYPDFFLITRDSLQAKY